MTTTRTVVFEGLQLQEPGAGLLGVAFRHRGDLNQLHGGALHVELRRSIPCLRGWERMDTGHLISTHPDFVKKNACQSLKPGHWSGGKAQGRATHSLGWWGGLHLARPGQLLPGEQGLGGGAVRVLRHENPLPDPFPRGRPIALAEQGSRTVRRCHCRSPSGKGGGPPPRLLALGALSHFPKGCCDFLCTDSTRVQRAVPV